MAILDAGVSFAREQVDHDEQAQRAKALVFLITRPARVRPRLRRSAGEVLLVAWMPSLSSQEIIATFG